MSNKKIGITLRTGSASDYDEQRDMLSQDWPIFLEKIGLTPIFIPNSLEKISQFLDEIEMDGFILSGRAQSDPLEGPSKYLQHV